MADVLDVVLAMLVGTVGTILFVAWDEKRLSPEAQARAWPVSTRWSAAAAFGPLCLPVHFARTRRSWGGFFLGVGVMGASIALVEALSALVHAVLD